jgi:hypothetical protein
MMMKRLGYAGAACLALALVFAACQNGVQEIEGSVGVGLSKVQLSMPASIIDPPIPQKAWSDSLPLYGGWPVYPPLPP